MMKKLLFIGLAVLLAAISGCAPKEKSLTEVNVGLSWIHEAQFAGLYAADQLGYFKEQGLNVTFYPYNDTDLASDLVNNKFDFVLLQTDTLLLARAQGLPVKAVFADYRVIPTAYFSKKESNITKIKDYIGKTVGVAYSERYPLVAILEKTGIPTSKVNIIDREYIYDKLALGEYDVEAGWVTDGDSVKAAVGEFNRLSPYDYGVNWYADIIVASEDTIQTNPELVESFVKAVGLGWSYSLENPELASRMALKYESEIKPEHLEYVLKASLPLIHTGKDKLGWMDADVFGSAQDILFRQGIMKQKIDANNVFTNEFIS
jgi:NitT/TauT family transport system substrate-binding protein